MTYHQETHEERKKRYEAKADKLLLATFKATIVVMAAVGFFRMSVEIGYEQALKKYGITEQKTATIAACHP